MKNSSIDADEFLSVVRPALQSCDVQALAEAIQQRWQPCQLCELLEHPRTEVRRVVCLTLGLVGDIRVSSCLSEALRDEDSQVNAMAEHALWSIWFRAGSPLAQQSFKSGLEAMERSELPDAIAHFERAQRTDSCFAEPYNQCAIAHYLEDQWQPALDDCSATLQLVPDHFGALAGMGHCHVQLNDLDQAARCYRIALEINPRMHAVASALARIQHRPGAAMA